MRTLLSYFLVMVSASFCWAQAPQELSPEELKQKRQALEQRLREVQTEREELQKARTEKVEKYGRRPTENIGEPQGISLTNGEERRYLRWEAPKWVAQRLLGHLICSGSPRELCLIFEGWVADFGVEDLVADTRLRFYDGQLYAYSVTFAPVSFSSILEILSGPLGEPDNLSAGEVQNTMGAHFDQQEAIWSKPSTDIVLQKRGNKITEGLLLIIYKPLEEQIPEEKGHAPF